MSAKTVSDLSELSLPDLFRVEVETQTALMTEDLLALESGGNAAERLEALMRGAHSLKGAARIVNRELAVSVAHAMEDYFVQAQQSGSDLPQARIDQLLRGVDLLAQIANVPENASAAWDAQHRATIEDLIIELSAPLAAASADGSGPEPAVPATAVAEATPVAHAPAPDSPAKAAEPVGRDLRVGAENVNRLLGLAGESVVASRWVEGFATELRRLKRMQNSLAKSLRGVGQSLGQLDLSEQTEAQLAELQSKAAGCQEALVARLEELELFDRRFVHLSKRLYQEVLDCRMRPFSDGVRGLPRMVRDDARSLGKEARLEILGETTPVDRDILERIEPSLRHLLRNAVDHGIDTPPDRLRAGKPLEATIRLEARHSAGMLLIEVSDDGPGIELDIVRRGIVEKRLTTAEVAARLTEPELLEFLFLPGFTMKEAVTEISGRGVGLDVVQTMIKEVGGSVRVFSQPGRGTRFQLQLPLTLSVLRTLLVEIAGEPYAFPLARINSAVRVPRGDVESIEGREHFTFGGQQIGLIAAQQVLGLGQSPAPNLELSVIIVGEKENRYGVVIDRFLGEQELVVRKLDPRLGKVKDISAAALMADQSPVLIIDVEDLTRSIENLISGGRLAQVAHAGTAESVRARKRVLVVDDSLTVRELERKLIESKGYEVEIAVDGMDGWNAVRIGQYDLVVTDVDMPRLDGIELVTLIKKDPRLSALPVMIVSYKDREEDRRRGLEAGADYYLTKGSFHDATLLRAVGDLIGDPE